MKNFTLIAMAFFMAAMASLNAMATEDPSALIANTSEQVRSALMTENGKNTDAVRADVEKIIFPRFDFNRMTALAIGKYWKEATPEQKQTLSNEFRILLTRTYYNVMLRYRDIKIDIKDDVLIENEGKIATVESDAKPANSKETISIDYVLYNTPEGWKVFNVVVEGASLVTVYRNQFGDEISKSGIDGLTQTLRNKNQAAHATASAISL